MEFRQATDRPEFGPHLTLGLNLLRGKWATIARVELLAHGEVIDDSVGESRLHFGDEYDWEIGDDYAIGRALKELGERLIENADLRVEAGPITWHESPFSDLFLNLFEEEHGTG